MASIAIRNLDDDIKQRLRVRDAPTTPSDLAAAIRACVYPGAHADFEVPAREPMCEPPPFGRQPG